MKFENLRITNIENAIRGMRNPKESYHLSDTVSGITNDRKKVYDLCVECAKAFYPDSWTQHDVDRIYKDAIIYDTGEFVEYSIIGPNDLKLALKLIKGGSEHRKFLRQIQVSVDITAPLYWWKEFDTYKVGTVANSTSTMHTVHKTPITIDNFETDDYHPELELIDPITIGIRVDEFIEDLEQLRQIYLSYVKKTKEANTPEEKKEFKRIAKLYWKELIRWTPEGWMQTRTVTMNYENLLAMCSKGQRRFHKLTEWSGCGEEFVYESFIKFARTLPYAQEFIFIDEVLN